MWRWVAGVAYVGLVGLELVGNDAWRTAATPYLDIALLVGLFPIAWRSLRRKTPAELAADERAALAALEGQAVDTQRAGNYGLLDENGKLAGPPTDAETTVDVISPKEPAFEPGLALIRMVLTLLVVTLVWFVGLLGLAVVGWLRALA